MITSTVLKVGRDGAWAIGFIFSLSKTYTNLAQFSSQHTFPPCEMHIFAFFNGFVIPVGALHHANEGTNWKKNRKSCATVSLVNISLLYKAEGIWYHYDLPPELW